EVLRAAFPYALNFSVIGKSYYNRDIIAVTVGREVLIPVSEVDSNTANNYSGSSYTWKNTRDSFARVMLVASQHGNEPLGREAALRFIELAANCIYNNIPQGFENLAEVLRAVTFIIVFPNPDGWAAETRTNGAGADLNRDYPTRDSRNYSPGYFSYPLSQPETRAVVELINRTRPDAAADLHGTDIQASNTEEFLLIPQRYFTPETSLRYSSFWANIASRLSEDGIKAEAGRPAEILYYEAAGALGDYFYDRGCFEVDVEFNRGYISSFDSTILRRACLFTARLAEVLGEEAIKFEALCSPPALSPLAGSGIKAGIFPSTHTSSQQVRLFLEDLGLKPVMLELSALNNSGVLSNISVLICTESNSMETSSAVIRRWISSGGKLIAVDEAGNGIASILGKPLDVYTEQDSFPMLTVSGDSSLTLGLSDKRPAQIAHPQAGGNTSGLKWTIGVQSLFLSGGVCAGLDSKRPARSMVSSWDLEKGKILHIGAAFPAPSMKYDPYWSGPNELVVTPALVKIMLNFLSDSNRSGSSAYFSNNATCFSGNSVSIYPLLVPYFNQTSNMNFRDSDRVENVSNNSTQLVEKYLQSRASRLFFFISDPAEVSVRVSSSPATAPLLPGMSSLPLSGTDIIYNLSLSIGLNKCEKRYTVQRLGIACEVCVSKEELNALLKNNSNSINAIDMRLCPLITPGNSSCLSASLYYSQMPPVFEKHNLSTDFLNISISFDNCTTGDNTTQSGMNLNATFFFSICRRWISSSGFSIHAQPDMPPDDISDNVFNLSYHYKSLFGKDPSSLDVLKEYLNTSRVNILSLSLTPAAFYKMPAGYQIGFTNLKILPLISSPERTEDNTSMDNTDVQGFSVLTYASGLFCSFNSSEIEMNAHKWEIIPDNPINRPVSNITISFGMNSDFFTTNPVYFENINGDSGDGESGNSPVAGNKKAFYAEIILLIRACAVVLNTNASSGIPSSPAIESVMVFSVIVSGIIDYGEKNKDTSNISKVVILILIFSLVVIFIVLKVYFFYSARDFVRKEKRQGKPYRTRSISDEKITPKEGDTCLPDGHSKDTVSKKQRTPVLKKKKR
ncbi:MAG: M14 family metallopeptidase, partial [Thermoplasmata archaeon]